MSYEKTEQTYERLVEGEAIVLNPRGNVWHWVAPTERQAKCGAGTWVTPMNAHVPEMALPFGPKADFEDITCLTCQKRYERYVVRTIKADLDKLSRLP